MKLFYQFGCTVIVLLSLSLFGKPTLAATATPPPETDEKTIVTSLTGTAIVPGWNFLKLGAASCAAGTIMDELQADAGGGVRLDSFWVGAGTSILAGQTWKEYVAADEKAMTSVIPAASKLALYTASRFYVDFNENACSQERPAKQKMQIQEARAVAVQNVAPVNPPKEKAHSLQQLLSPSAEYSPGLWKPGPAG